MPHARGRGPVPRLRGVATVTTRGSGATAAPQRASTMAAKRPTVQLYALKAQGQAQGWGCWRKGYRCAAGAAADASGSAGQVSQDQGRAGREHGACIRAQQRREARRAQNCAARLS